MECYYPNRHKYTPLPAILEDTTKMWDNSIINYRILVFIILAIGLMFAYFGLAEFYNVKIAGQESAYAFGQVNENNWLYYSASTYATYNLVCGIAFLVAFLTTLIGVILKKERLFAAGAIMTFLFLFGQTISCNA
jgi:hypothetical protein